MRYKVVRVVGRERDGRLKWATDEFSEKDVVAGVEALGHRHKGWTENTMVLPEMRGQPTFEGLYGPMFEGDHCRYENADACDFLSF